VRPDMGEYKQFSENQRHLVSLKSFTSYDESSKKYVSIIIKFSYSFLRIISAGANFKLH
jgi:hypothetical protein